MEQLQIVLSIIISAGAVAGIMYRIFKQACKPFDRIEKQFKEQDNKLDQILEMVSHNTTTNRYLLKYRIEQLCFKAFDEAKRTGKEEIDKHDLATINNLYEEYKYFKGNSTVDIIVDSVKKFKIME